MHPPLSGKRHPFDNPGKEPGGPISQRTCPSYRDRKGESSGCNAVNQKTKRRVRFQVSGGIITTDNLLRNKAFTVSVGDVEHMAACDYVGLVSANKEENKMEKAGFTTTKSEFVNAPVINELPLTLECELTDVIGGSKIFGKIVNVSIDEKVLGEDGELSLEKFSPITYDTVHYGYYRLGERVGNAFKDGNALK